MKIIYIIIIGSTKFENVHIQIYSLKHKKKITKI